MKDIEDSVNPLPKTGIWLTIILFALIITSAMYVKWEDKYIKVKQKVTRCRDCVESLDSSVIWVTTYTTSDTIECNLFRLIDGYELTTYCKNIDSWNVIYGDYSYIDSVKCIEYNNMKTRAKRILAKRKEDERLLKELNDKKCR